MHQSRKRRPSALRLGSLYPDPQDTTILWNHYLRVECFLFVLAAFLPASAL